MFVNPNSLVFSMQPSVKPVVKSQPSFPRTDAPSVVSAISKASTLLHGDNRPIDTRLASLQVKINEALVALEANLDEKSKFQESHELVTEDLISKIVNESSIVGREFEKLESERSSKMADMKSNILSTNTKFYQTLTEKTDDFNVKLGDAISTFTRIETDVSKSRDERKNSQIGVSEDLKNSLRLSRQELSKMSEDSKNDLESIEKEIEKAKAGWLQDLRDLRIERQVGLRSVGANSDRTHQAMMSKIDGFHENLKKDLNDIEAAVLNEFRIRENNSKKTVGVTKEFVKEYSNTVKHESQLIKLHL
jgi:hypothetical protein